MALTTVKELLEAGVHFGSATQRWNPRMKPFIHGSRNKIHIIDLKHTVRGLARASHFLREVASTGRQIVFVCTKRQMRGLLMQEATRVGMPWVTERWLGGTLTNFRTVRSRLARLEEIEEMEASGHFEDMKKKEMSQLNRERRRIKKNLDGLRELNRIPGAVFVVDPKREEIAVAEARRMGVPVVAILDTDCDPSGVDIPIPANDDSMRAVSLLPARLTNAVEEGVKTFKASGAMPEDAVGVRKGDKVREVTEEDKAMAVAAAKAEAEAKPEEKPEAKQEDKTEGEAKATPASQPEVQS